MKRIWNYVEQKEWNINNKNKAYLWITCSLSALFGLVIWSIVRIWTLKTWPWFVSFVGYPAVISLFVSTFYLYRHEFHNGTQK